MVQKYSNGFFFLFFFSYTWWLFREDFHSFFIPLLKHQQMSRKTERSCFHAEKELSFSLKRNGKVIEEACCWGGNRIREKHNFSSVNKSTSKIRCYLSATLIGFTAITSEDLFLPDDMFTFIFLVLAGMWHSFHLVQCNSQLGFVWINLFQDIQVIGYKSINDLDSQTCSCFVVL